MQDEQQGQDPSTMGRVKIEIAGLRAERDRLLAERDRARALLRELFNAETEFGNRLNMLVMGIWPDLWDRVTKELEQ